MKRKVRLETKELECICQAFKLAFQKSDQLWLFGSRADLNKKGGDIDLFIKTNYKTADEVYDAKLKFLDEIFMHLEEQKIDVVIQYGSHFEEIYKVAQDEGVRII